MEELGEKHHVCMRKAGKRKTSTKKNKFIGWKFSLQAEENPELEKFNEEENKNPSTGS